MSVGVNPPRTPVTKGSNGTAIATVPNVCKMPGPPAPFVPTPLPNIGQSNASPKGYTKKVKVEGQPAAIKGATFASKGDMASKGTGGGLLSANTHGITSFVGPGSMDVKFEGKNVQLLGDPMLNNCAGSGNPANAATLAGVLQGVATPGLVADIGDQQLADDLCQAACEAMHEPDPNARTRQDQMAARFSQTNANGRPTPPVYQASSARILPEVSQRIPSSAGGGMSTLMSRTGRTVAGTSTVAPRSMIAAMRTSTAASPITRWDFVIPSINGSARNNLIRKYVEVKFPGDTLTQNQQLARANMTAAERAKVVEMEPAKDCKCTKNGKTLAPPKP